MGPVIKLPTDTKIVMRMEGSGGCNATQKNTPNKVTPKPAANIEDLKAKIDQVYVLEKYKMESLRRKTVTHIDLFFNDGTNKSCT